MKNNLILILTIILLFILQSSVFAFWPLGNVTPDLMICAVVSFGFMRGSKTGLWLGFFSGLILDIFFGFYLGFYALLYMYAGFLNGIFRRYGYAEEIKFPIMLTAVCEFVINSITWFFLFYLRGRRDFFYYMRTIILPKTIYTALLAVLLSYVFLRIHQWMLKSSERGSREIDL